MKNQKSQRGITLIALVVTIVVLLILAGITIAFVLSDGGIFQSAKDAKIEQMRATIMDYAVQIAPTLTAKYYALGGGHEQVQLTTDAEEIENDPDHYLDLQKFFPGFKVIDRGIPGYYGDGVFHGGFYVVADDGLEISDYRDLSFIDEEKIFTINFGWKGQVVVERGIHDVPYPK